jgi:hypothetical protein
MSQFSVYFSFSSTFYHRQVTFGESYYFVSILFGTHSSLGNLTLFISLENVGMHPLRKRFIEIGGSTPLIMTTTS